MWEKGFTLIELMVVVALIGMLAVVGSSFDFNKKGDVEKRDRFIAKIESMMHTSKIAMTSGKGILSGVTIINPDSIKIIFSTWAIVTNYFDSGGAVIWTGEVMTSPFYWEIGYNIANFYWKDKTSLTGSVTNLTTIFSNNGEIYFTGSASHLSSDVIIGMTIGYHTTKKILEFDKRFGQVTIR